MPRKYRVPRRRRTTALISNLLPKQSSLRVYYFFPRIIFCSQIFIMSEAKPGTPKEPQEEVFFSTGRGGAGNMGKGDSLPSPKLEPQRSRISTNENDLSPIYSTGRGGFGNMQNKKDLGEMAHLDEEMGIAPVHSKTMNEQQQHVAVGRGGYGNVLTASQSRGLEDKDASAKDTKPRSGFLRKIKNLFN